MPKKLDDGVREVLAKGVKEQPGRTKEEAAYAIYAASTAHKAYTGEITTDLVQAVTKSKWPGLASAAEGEPLQHVASLDLARPSLMKAESKEPKGQRSAINHVVSPDNGASYAELWSRGGNWYAVTGAGINEIDDVKKGMTVYDVMPRFISALTKASCIPCAQAGK